MSSRARPWAGRTPLRPRGAARPQPRHPTLFVQALSENTAMLARSRATQALRSRAKVPAKARPDLPPENLASQVGSHGRGQARGTRLPPKAKPSACKRDRLPKRRSTSRPRCAAPTTTANSPPVEGGPPNAGRLGSWSAPSPGWARSRRYHPPRGHSDERARRRHPAQATPNMQNSSVDHRAGAVALLASMTTVLIARARTRTEKLRRCPPNGNCRRGRCSHRRAPRHRLLREALPHHVVLAKLPLVRLCQPTGDGRGALLVRPARPDPRDLRHLQRQRPGACRHRPRYRRGNRDARSRSSSRCWRRLSYPLPALPRSTTCRRCRNCSCWCRRAPRARCRQPSPATPRATR